MTPAALADLVRSVAHDVLTGRGLDPVVLPATVTVERPRVPEHGDYATNVALQTGTRAGVPPRELAGWLAHALAQRHGLRSVEVAGPGFVNLRLAAGAQGDIVAQVIAAGERFGAVQGRPTRRFAGVEELPPVRDAQYVHARLAALARNAADLGFTHQGAQLDLLDHEREGALIRALGEFPRIVAASSRTTDLGDPRRVVRYLEQLVRTYHRFDGCCRVLPMGDEQPSPHHAARLALCEATRQVLANGLGLLGAYAPE
ncbi:MAG: DALR anticodon-binding domain-containing protein, partial [Pseudonocardiaceae bacterium]